MKIIFVVDDIENFNNKLNTITTHLGNDVHFVVKANLVSLFKTFGQPASAVYTKNLTEVIHHLVSRLDADDIVIYYSSLKIDINLINEFVKNIGDKNKIVNVMPKYNVWENFCNEAYNVYVRSIFKTNDSMISPKLQFLPLPFVNELLESHFGNKLFEIKPEFSRTIYVQNKDINKTLKVKTKFNKFQLLPIIVALAITALLITCLGLFKLHFVLIVAFVLLYVLDIVLALIYQCKLYFDERFLK